MENSSSVRRSARLMAPHIKELDAYIDHNGLDYVSNDNVCVYAIYHGDANIVRTLLTIGRIDPTTPYTNCERRTIYYIHPQFVKLACKRNRSTILDMLLKCERLEHPGGLFMYREEFITACEKGRLNIVKVMLDDPRLNPGMRKNAPLQVASANGHVRVVKLLLQYRGVKPAANNYYALAAAYKYGHSEVVDVLLRDLSEPLPEALAVDMDGNVDYRI